LETKCIYRVKDKLPLEQLGLGFDVEEFTGFSKQRKCGLESSDIFFIVLLRIREGKALTGKWRVVFYERGFGGKQNLVDV
jgi:hypothetical protein